MKIKVIDGYSVEDFRQPLERRKVEKVVKKYSHEDVEPRTITDPNMIRIKDQNLKNIIGKSKITHLVKQKEVRSRSRKRKSLRNSPSLRDASCPKSLFPPLCCLTAMCVGSYHVL